MSALGRGVGGGWGKRESWEGELQSGGTPGTSGARVASVRSCPPLGAWWAERLLVGGGWRPRGCQSQGRWGVGAAPVALGSRWRAGVR